MDSSAPMIEAREERSEAEFRLLSERFDPTHDNRRVAPRVGVTLERQHHQ